jgi:hypothetical protein
MEVTAQFHAPGDLVPNTRWIKLSRPQNRSGRKAKDKNTRRFVVTLLTELSGRLD